MTRLDGPLCQARFPRLSLAALLFFSYLWQTSAQKRVIYTVRRGAASDSPSEAYRNPPHPTPSAEALVRVREAFSATEERGKAAVRQLSDALEAALADAEAGSDVLQAVFQVFLPCFNRRFCDLVNACLLGFAGHGHLRRAEGGARHVATLTTWSEGSNAAEG